MSTNDNAVTCSTSAASIFELIAGCLGKESSGNVYLRTHKVTPVEGSNAIDCGSGINSDEELLVFLRNAICLDSNGDMAIRISQTT
jgi:hypothetical protein